MTEKITQSRDYEEVAHYVIEQFLIHPKAEELVDRGEAMKFMSGMIYRNYNSSTSPYHKLYRQSGRVYATDPSKWNIASLRENDTEDESQVKNLNLVGKSLKEQLQTQEVEDYDYEKDMQIDAVQGIIEDMHAEGIHYWYIATLFQMWVDTPNYSELSRQTMIPRTSIAQAVEEAREYILNRLKENGIIN